MSLLFRTWIACALGALTQTGCAGCPPPESPAASAPDTGGQALPPAVAAAVGAADRSSEDRALDPGRKPGETLAFFEVAPGQRVAELGAGAGYTTELLARVVGPIGTVFAQNSQFILQRFAERPWAERLQKSVMSRVVRVDRDFDDPFPPEANQLDAVINVLFYHDTVWFGVDRDRMNARVYAALRPGGLYGIVDHSAAPGAGVSVAGTLHRIEERTLVAEVTRAGFVLEASSGFLRNPGDPRDWNAAPRAAGARRGTSDRFVLRFRKPRSRSLMPPPAGSL